MYIFYLGLILTSLAGMAWVLFSKIFEMQTGRVGFFTRVSVDLDPRIVRDVRTVRFFILRHVNLGNVKRVLTLVSGYLFHAFGTVGLFVAKHYGNFTRQIRGKKFIKGGGVVSFFLKNVAESKEESEKKDL
jgi:hypothetical protein